MRLFATLGISGSALTAQRLRMDIIANNLANVDTTRTASGEPYRRMVPVFAPLSNRAFADLLAEARGTASLGGVKVTAIRPDPSPFKLKYDPGHPDAGPDGYVRLPNVDAATEMVDLISATRSYEANVTALNAAKAMFLKALEIGR
ncbi:MAG: flagellar basal body rod protein FlgC [Bacillota bacterium]